MLIMITNHIYHQETQSKKRSHQAIMNSRIKNDKWNPLRAMDEGVVKDQKNYNNLYIFKPFNFIDMFVFILCFCLYIGRLPVIIYFWFFNGSNMGSM